VPEELEELEELELEELELEELELLELELDELELEELVPPPPLVNSPPETLNESSLAPSSRR